MMRYEIDDVQKQVGTRATYLRKCQGVTSEEIARRLSRNGYPIGHGAYRGLENPSLRSMKINKHLVNTLALVFDVPREDIVSDAEYAYLKDKPKRYGKPPAGTYTKDDKVPLEQIVSSVLDMHHAHAISGRCVECGHLHPCETVRILTS